MFSFATKFSPEAANFEKAVFAGFENAELYLTPTRLMSWRSLSKIARSYDLNYALHFPTTGTASRTGTASSQTCEEIVSLAHDICCSFVSVHEDSLEVAQRIRTIDPRIQLSVENQTVEFDKLDSWILANDNITLNVEFLWKNTLKDCDLDQLKSVVGRLFHNYGDRFRAVHLSGYSPGGKIKSPLFKSAEMVSAIFDTLLAENYHGMVVSEIDVEQQTSHNLKEEFDLFNQWRNKRGIPYISSYDSCFQANTSLNGPVPG